MQTESHLVRCGNCGTESRQTILLHADEHEPPDIDTRPGEPLRSSIGFWVQRCPFCGYCAADLSSIHEAAAPVVETPLYQSQLIDPRFPEKSNEFIAYAILLERVGQYADAGWTSLHAAWIADDAQNTEAAAVCRRAALRAWSAGKTRGQSFHESHVSEFLIACDVHRRLGEFEYALTACNEGSIEEDLPELMDHCFRLERALISRKETGRASMRELPIFRNTGSAPKPS